MFWFSVLLLAIWTIIYVYIDEDLEEMSDKHRFLIFIATQIINIACFAFVDYTHEREISHAVSAAISKERQESGRLEE